MTKPDKLGKILAAETAAEKNPETLISFDNSGRFQSSSQNANTPYSRTMNVEAVACNRPSANLHTRPLPTGKLDYLIGWGKCCGEWRWRLNCNGAIFGWVEAGAGSVGEGDLGCVRNDLVVVDGSWVLRCNRLRWQPPNG